MTKFYLSCLSLKDDKTAESFITNVIRNSMLYVGATVTVESYLICGGSSLDAQFVALENSQTAAQNSLFNSITICNEYLAKHASGLFDKAGIFSGTASALRRPDHQAIGKWAGELVQEIFDGSFAGDDPQ